MEDFIKKVREYALENYERGGDYIIECFTDKEIVDQFATLEEVVEWCKLKHDLRKEVEATVW